MDYDNSNSTSSLDLVDSISLLTMDDERKQRKQMIHQTYKASIDSDYLIALDSEYLLGTMSLSNIVNEPIVDKKY